jgi:hypothetical protein
LKVDSLNRLSLLLVIATLPAAPVEYYSVNELKVNFTTRDLPTNFAGFADYAADSNIDVTYC